MAFGFPNVSPRSVLEPFRGFLTVRSEIVQASFRPDSGRVQQNSRCEAQAVTSCLPSLATAAWSPHALSHPQPAGRARRTCLGCRRGDFWYLQTSVYTRHFNPDPEHNNHQDLLGLEYNRADGVLAGGATFRNSFSQRSNYAYLGKRFDSDSYPVYLKLTGGLLQGYRGEYRDKIPLNRFGVAPAIIPSVGVRFGPLGSELVLLGNSAAMINLGLRL